VFAISLSVFAALRPYLLKQTVDGYIKHEDAEGVILYHLDGYSAVVRSILPVLLCFWANWLGQDIVKTFESNYSNTSKFQNEIF
jgi:hypothetical protein